MNISFFGGTGDGMRVAIKEALELYLEVAPDSNINQVADVEVKAMSVGII